MKRVLGVFVLAAAALLAAPSANAQQQPVGWYGAGSLGYLQLRDQDFDTGGLSGHSEFDPGVALSVAGGYAFGNGFRAELEGGYGHSSFDSVTANGTKFSVGGDIDMWSIYGAGYYDFTIANTKVKPYLGGGLGWVHTELSNASVNGVSVSGGNDDNWSWFAEGGLSYPLSDRLDLVPAIRYTWLDNGSNGVDDNEAWTFKIGLRYAF